MRKLDASSPEGAAFARVQPVCSFVNTEVARLRNMSIAIAASCAAGAVVLPLVTGIGDPRIPLVLAAGIFTFWFARARAEVAANCTNIAAKRMIAAVSKALTYKRTSSLTLQQFVATDLFNERVGRWKSRDEIGGRVGGTRYSLHRVRAAGTERPAVVFDGVIIKIDFSSAFPSHIMIIPDRDGQMPGSRVRKDLVMLKNPAFERLFSVYATDYYEARRLIRPGLMEIVVEAAGNFQAGLRLAFVHKSLFVAVAGDGLRVEAPLFGAPLTPRHAVGQLLHMVALAERLTKAVAEEAWSPSQ